MPIDYRKYHPEWKSRIRPDILTRANNCCEVCKVRNHSFILRGEYRGVPAYQDDDGNIFSAIDGKELGADYVGEVCTNEKTTFIRVVLTIAHLDHNIENNDYANLKALCQRCHIHYDKELHKENSKKTRVKKKKQISIEF
jgi:hypothetical protein